MDNLFEIIKKRSTPGILVFDMNNRLHYSNSEALDMISALRRITESGTPGKQHIPEEIYSLCNLVKRKEDKERAIPADSRNCAILHSKDGPSYSMRAFCIGHQPGNKVPTHIMVLLEKVIDKHRADYEKIKNDFKLTKRELDVVMLICDGLTNREISETLSISEYTVKDHIKNIMRKTTAASRSEIITRTIQ